MISLKCYNKKELQKLIDSGEFTEFPFLPITKHRAISHLENPRADDQDILLILVFENEKLAGYLGILPDFIFHKDEKTKIGWLSTIFVHPNFRGKKIGQLLLQKACERYDDNILMTEFTPEAEAIYIKSGNFIKLPVLEGYTFYYKSHLKKILPQKKKFWRHWTFFLNIADVLTHSFFDGIPKKTISKERYLVTSILDDEAKDFLIKNETKNSFKRNQQELDWIVNFPWVLENNLTEKQENNYEFSSSDKEFNTYFIKLFSEEKKLENILVITIRNKTVKLHYHFGNPQNMLFTAIFLRYFLINTKAESFISYDKDVNSYLSKEILRFKKKRTRKYLMHKNLEKLLGNDFIFEVSSGDGDCIFT